MEDSTKSHENGEISLEEREAAMDMMASLKGSADLIGWSLTQLKYPQAKSEWDVPSTEPEFMIPGWLPANRVTILAGRGGSGKSKLAFQLCCGIAGPFDEWIKDGPKLATKERSKVMFATWEQDFSEFRRMADDWSLVSSFKDKAERQKQISRHLDGFFHYINLSKYGPLWEQDKISDAGKHLLAQCDLRAIKFLVIDPSAAAFGGNENSRNEVRRFMSYLDGWAREQGCTVLIIAHPAKGEGQAADYSGSTDWHNAARAMWTLGLEPVKTGSNDKITILECLKVNAARKPKPLQLDNWRWWEVQDNAERLP